jgi:hypothetical protein
VLRVTPRVAAPRPLPRSESAAYAKRLKNEVKGLTKRLKNVGADLGPKICCDRDGKQLGEENHCLSVPCGGHAAPQIACLWRA